ncbi:hypothetical protein [Actinomadura litoris]|uniref:hypothetical protein n=1 Tax=Actinomadura litoris TaxID=2678616 RepID=UPI001FA70824|nr:hypothetical protein [Actinomadura litoris]
MRFHLIDRIESWDAGERISARKVTSRQEARWAPALYRGPDRDLLPFGLTLEALCQAATWLIMLSTGHRRRAVLLTVGEAVAHRPVRFGEVLHMTAVVESMSDEAALVGGVVAVDGEPVLEAAGVLCALRAGAELEDPADTRRMAGQLLDGGRVR